MSKIKSATYYTEKFYKGEYFLLDIIKEAQQQAIEATLDEVKAKGYGLHYEDAFDRNPSFVDVCEQSLNKIKNSEELKV